MKRILLLGIVLCVCLGLFGCVATDPENLFEMPSESTEENADSVPGEVVTYTGTYPYGNMQKNIPPGGFVLLDNKVIFSQKPNGKSLLYCYDLITEEVHLYCEDATCTHEECIASILQTNLQVYNGDLYGLTLTKEKIEQEGKMVTDIVCFPVIVRENMTEIITSADVNPSLTVLWFPRK